DRGELAALPTSGSAWDYLRQQAARAGGSGHLANYDDRDPYNRVPAKHLAAALVHARTGDRAARAVVVRALDGLRGTEERSSTVGTSSSDRLLATVRQLPAWIMAADLVGYQSSAFTQWLRVLVDKPIGTHGRWRTIRGCSDDAANNWGAMATQARVAIAAYLRDEAALAAASARFGRFLGDRSLATQFRKTSDFDLSFVAVPAGANPSTDWTAVNPVGPKSGIIVEDLSRSAGSYPRWDSSGIGYTHETLGAMLTTATLLDAVGRPPWEWSDRAILRAANWLNSVGRINGDWSLNKWPAWVLNHVYGASFPTTRALMGRQIGFTDWLYG
ncbi:MAG TPA: hypothetical protein VK506_14715, partial [Conexibacter sp.]|nr:hypothetical protein [Conexibacter sp.]